MISKTLEEKALDFIREVEGLAKDEGYQAAKKEFDEKVSQMQSDFDKRIVEAREAYYNEGYNDCHAAESSESTSKPTEVMNYTDGTEFVNDKVKMVALFSYARKYTTTKWCTIILPVSLNYSDWSSKFEIAEITGVEIGTNITPKHSVLGIGSQTLPNHPYLIRLKKSSSSTQVISKKDCAVYPSVPGNVEIVKDGKKYTFKGIYVRLSAEELSGKYYSNSGVFVKAVKGCNPMRVYLEITK